MTNHVANHDWRGENLSGLILMKVRDELSNQLPSSHSAETTLGERA